LARRTGRDRSADTEVEPYEGRESARLDLGSHGPAARSQRGFATRKDAEAALGHADISITLNTYSHVTPTMQAEAANTVALLVLGDQP
jgi:integrase